MAYSDIQQTEFNRATENLIEITWTYVNLQKEFPKLSETDSMGWKQMFVVWANEFEENFGRTDWDESEKTYQEAIEEFASYSPERGNEPEIIDRDYYRQGWIFKDEDAFQNRPDDVCYIPELSDEKYTRNDILKILAGDEELAETMFEELDWQHPESLLEDWKANGEIAWCPHCAGYVQTYDEEIEKCPVCGTELED